MEKFKILLRGCAKTGVFLLAFIFWPFGVTGAWEIQGIIFILWLGVLSGVGYYFGYYTLVIIPCLFPIACLCAMQEEKERAEQERLMRAREQERKRRFPFSAWWNIPRGSTIIIDTCVWIEAYKELDDIDDIYKKLTDGVDIYENPFEIWIHYVIKNAVKNDWTLFLPKEVVDEIAKKKEERHTATGAAARAAHRCLMEAQATLLPKGRFKGEFKARVHGINLYADPVFVNLLKQDKSMRLYTLDNHVALVARQNIGDVERVYSRDQFEEFCKYEVQQWA